MRARDFAFWLAFALAGPSFAQNAAYSKFPAATADTCATACTSDRMCASWSFGGTAPTVETSNRRKKDMAPPPRMCALSQSLTPVRQSGVESGLPRRSGVLTPAGRYSDGPANYEVRTAPWLDPRSRMPQPAPAHNQGAPIAQPAMISPAPAPAPSAGRVEFIPHSAGPAEISAPRAGARGTPRSRREEVTFAPAPQSNFEAPRPAPAATPSAPQMSYSPPPVPASQPMQPLSAPPQASDLSKFRGSDGMVDAAAMRRAQINSARATGQAAYAVQREWEAVEEERQRAAANGQVRADPLAGTVPVPEAPQPKSTRPRPSYDAAEPNPSSDQGEAAPAEQKPASKSKGARGTPRAEQTTRSSQSTLAEAARARARNPSYIDREPRLSGGPGG
ncbi:MAG: hypothetical protein ACK5DN_04210 [Hyphomonadaceae bacterium]|jgi:hypothetical protein